MVKVFVSGTKNDLTEYRQAVFDQLERMEVQGVKMEYFGASDDTPLEVSLSKLGECDIYLGIIGHLYGSVPPNETRSYTQCEYEHAVKLKQQKRMRILLYLASDEVKIPPHLAMKDNLFKQGEFRQSLKRRTPRFFKSPDDLARWVTVDIQRLAAEVTPSDDDDEDVEIFDIDDDEMIRRTFDSAAKESLDRIQTFIDFVAKSFGNLFTLDTVSLDSHPFFKNVREQLGSIIPGVSLNDEGGILKRAGVRHVILRTETVVNLIKHLDAGELHSVGKDIGRGAARDLLENTVNENPAQHRKGLVPRSSEAFVFLWNFWDRTGGWGTLEVVGPADKPDDARTAFTEGDAPEWYIRIKNNFLRAESINKTHELCNFWRGYIHGFLDMALPRISEKMSGLNDVRRREVNLPEFHRVLSVEHLPDQDVDEDVFRITFKKELLSDCRQSLSKSQRRLKEGESETSMLHSRAALSSARDVLGVEEFDRLLNEMDLTDDEKMHVAEIRRTPSPPPSMVTKDKAVEWFMAANRVVQRLYQVKEYGENIGPDDSQP